MNATKAGWARQRFELYSRLMEPADLEAIVEGRQVPSSYGFAAINMARCWLRQIGALPPKKGRARVNA